MENNTKNHEIMKFVGQLAAQDWSFGNPGGLSFGKPGGPKFEQAMGPKFQQPRGPKFQHPRGPKLLMIISYY